MCTTVQLWVGKGGGSFCCALAWWERWEGEIQDGGPCVLPLPPQTFQFGVKHFGSASSNISARRSQMLGTN
jgi:hypothetical protein